MPANKAPEGHLVFKAYVYLTCGRDLLVMYEPEMPEDSRWWIPGGTVDPGESFLQGALREFAEETGLQTRPALDLLSREAYLCTETPRPTWQMRALFHGRISRKPALSWDHYEHHSSRGEGSILMRYQWLDLTEPANLLPDRFHLDFQRPLPLLRHRLGLTATAP